MTEDTIAERAAAAMWREDRASQALGMAIDAVADGYARLSMTVAPHMANGQGLCHGGFIFTLADSAFAFACNSHGPKAVAQHCAVTFLRPGRVGDRLVAEARERGQAGRAGVCDVTVSATAGVVAEFRGLSRTVPGDWLDAHG